MKAVELSWQERNNQLIEEFLASLPPLSKGRIRKLRYSLGVLSRKLGKNFEDVTKEELKKFIIEINNDEKLSESTKSDYREIAKRFFRWLYTEDFVSWIKVDKGVSAKVLPEDILTKNEVQRIIYSCEIIRDKALVSSLYESGVISKPQKISLAKLDKWWEVKGKVDSEKRKLTKSKVDFKEIASGKITEVKVTTEGKVAEEKKTTVRKPIKPLEAYEYPKLISHIEAEGEYLTSDVATVKIWLNEDMLYRLAKPVKIKVVWKKNDKVVKTQEYVLRPGEEKSYIISSLDLSRFDEEFARGLWDVLVYVDNRFSKLTTIAVKTPQQLLTDIATIGVLVAVVVSVVAFAVKSRKKKTVSHDLEPIKQEGYRKRRTKKRKKKST
jgi:hypothetical protein